MRALTYIEIDVPDFNVISSPNETVTFRFTYDCDYLPSDIEAIPSLVSIQHSPSTISLGKDLGTRASLTCSFSDHLHIFNTEAFDSGTFWGKWRARYGQKLQSKSLRWIQGLEGQTLAEMETRHFVIESTDGPTPNGVYSIKAQDVLKLADGDRAQAPFPNNGFMVGSIDDNDLAFTLSPSGVGNEEYATSGYLALGGEEIVSFTRSADSVTIVARGQLGTTAVAHDAGSRVQQVLRYVGEDPADIIYDLFVNYAGINSDYIPLASWLIETGAFLQQNYSANIAEPTSVNKLVSELVEQAALVIWWEPLTQLIRLQVLREISTTAARFTEDNTIEGSLTIREQPNTRLSQVFTYFGQRNPLSPIDEEQNFRSAALTVQGDAELEYGTPMIKKIYSRWIPFGARTVALRLNDLILGRFRDPPRKFSLSLFRHGEENPMLGGGYRVESWSLQNVDGSATNAPIQITRLNPLSDRYEIEAEEMLFENLDPADLVNRVIIIDADINNINLRDLHDSIYPDPDVDAVPAESLTVYVNANVVVGSDDSTLISFDVGDWPVGYPIEINLSGRITGAGGDGGDPNSDEDPVNGRAGGTAIYTRFQIDLVIDSGGEVWGGGGGGGASVLGGAGGGGAGRAPGSIYPDESSTPAEPGSEELGGAGGDGVGTELLGVGGDGGDPGQPGEDGEILGVGGAAGNAIDGISFITLTNNGSIIGPQVN